MPEAISGSACKRADLLAINEWGIDSLELMENASQSVCRYLREHLPGKKLLVLCGTGNNGADGLCIARIMKARAIVAGNLEKGSWEFHHQLAQALKNGIEIEFYHGQPLGDYEVLVDAVFGIGLKRNVEGQFRELLEKADEKFSYRVAVDVPSGINADTGEVMGCAVRADVTITFGRNKTGLVNNKLAGKVIVEDIGIPEEVYEKAGR